MKLTCAEPTCDRPPMRTRDGQRWCSWHPDATPPAVDALTGKLRDPQKPTKAKQQPAPATRRPDPDLELQRELEHLEQIDPAVAAAAKSYDRAVDSILATPQETPAMTQPLQTTPAGTSADALLAKAKEHGNARVRRLGERIEASLVDLRALMLETDAAERRRLQQEKEREEARAEVERLEQQLAEARAKAGLKKAKRILTPAAREAMNKNLEKAPLANAARRASA